jgi:hypothetical protein
LDRLKYRNAFFVACAVLASDWTRAGPAVARKTENTYTEYTQNISLILAMHAHRRRRRHVISNIGIINHHIQHSFAA